MRSPAKLYQNAIASAVQTIADRKNSLGRGKNETNMFGVHARARDLRTPLQDAVCVAKGRNTASAAIMQIITGQSKLIGSEPATASAPGDSRNALEMG